MMKIRYRKTKWYVGITVIACQLVFIIFTYVQGPWDHLLVKVGIKTHSQPSWINLTMQPMRKYMDPLVDSILIQPNNSTLFKQSVLGVIFVMSLPESYAKRQAIRNSWYKWKDQFHLQILFFIGAPSSKHSLHKLRVESIKYQDILVDNIKESYNTLPVKVLRAMKAFLQLYKSPKTETLPFFVKTDDDVFINVPNLVNTILKIKYKEYVGGYLFPVPVVNRDPFSKFYVPKSLYKEDKYPAYVGGFCYVISGNLIRRIYEESLLQTFFPFEDAFITGFVANRNLHVKLINIDGLYDSASGNFTVYENSTELIKSVAITPVEPPFSMEDLFKRIKDLNSN